MSKGTVILPKVSPGDIRRSRDIGRVVQELEALDHDTSWRVWIEECKSERSLQQNKYLFGIAYRYISEATGCEKAEVHTDLLKLHFGVRLKRVLKSREFPDGWREVPLRTTTTGESDKRATLDPTMFWEYVEFVQRWAATNLNLSIPDPDSSLAVEPKERAA